MAILTENKIYKYVLEMPLLPGDRESITGLVIPKTQKNGT